MCLSIPGKLESIEKQLDDIFRVGKVSFGEIKKDINLSMVPDAKIGDYVLVHVGVAISIIDEDEAKRTFDLLLQMGEVDEMRGE